MEIFEFKVQFHEWGQSVILWKSGGHGGLVVLLLSWICLGYEWSLIGLGYSEHLFCYDFQLRLWISIEVCFCLFVIDWIKESWVYIQIGLKAESWVQIYLGWTCKFRPGPSPRLQIWWVSNNFRTGLGEFGQGVWFWFLRYNLCSDLGL